MLLSGKTALVMLNVVDELGMKSTDKASNEAEAVKEAVRDTPVGLSTADNLWQLLGLVFVLIIVLVAAYYTTKYVGNIKLGQMKNSNFTAIDSYRLSPNKLLQIVKIGNKYVVIAITKDNINFITELDEDEVLLREDQPVERPDFKKILEKLRNKK
ncbi:flagellar biosynthetic protein FliO [Lachnospiraceae bacterium MD1]|jgi:flagellar protein FliO/FliZ|uniref:Flagellar biosynthetic protein FliO n=1 Tax=Variimorphobacter saccharofermentans TaxID=2755051 RepID=A0A839K0P2_9FIRM|nr:flagellar biosynthetic protein FliO [Variimorphobacter saccharofermentans]MBB2182752.1 flagellar biosynthetic protein FliO [Variimorphobacter saccharofermentans]